MIVCWLNTIKFGTRLSAKKSGEMPRESVHYTCIACITVVSAM